MKLAIHPPNWLGDVIMAQPAMRAVVAGSTPSSLVLVGRPWLKELAPWLGLGEAATSEGMPADADAIVLLPNSFRVAWQAWRAGIPRRIGFRGRWRGLLLTEAPAPRVDMRREHHRRYFLDLAEQSGFSAADEHVALSTPDGAVEAGQALLEQQGLIPANTVAIAPGAQFGGAKRYPAERYRKIAAALARQGWQLLVLGTRAERAIGEQVLAGLDHCWNSAGETDLHDALQLIAACRLLLCNDSGLMHVAAGIGKPVVALFGATDPARTAPDGPRVTLLYRPVDCSPCLKRECAVSGHPCMANIPPEEVTAACLHLLGA